MARRLRGFTLVELLVVLTIILLVSVATLPAILTATGERAILAGAAELQGALVGARDAAIRAGVPRGIRLELDPTFPPSRLADGTIDPASALVSDRWVAMGTAPDYAEGFVSTYPTQVYPDWMRPVPALVLEQQPGEWVQDGAGWTFVLLPPTNWWHTLRVGERVRIDGAGPYYTICGPRMVATPEGFLDGTPPAGEVPFERIYTAPDGTQARATPQWMMLVNGQDDNHDGYIDDGWDGIDNDGANGIDDAGEWEIEAWSGPAARGVRQRPYVASRRPVPIDVARASTLPAGVVVDLTTALTSRERSRLPVDPTTGTATIMVRPDGTPEFDMPYGIPSIVGMDSAWRHLWLTERSAIHPPTSGATAWNLLPDFSSSRNRIVSMNRAGNLSVTDPGESFDAAGAMLRSRQPFATIEQ